MIHQIVIIIIQKTSGSLWHSQKDEVVLDSNGNAFDFTVNNTTNLFKYKTKTTGKTGS